MLTREGKSLLPRELRFCVIKRRFVLLRGHAEVKRNPTKGRESGTVLHQSASWQLQLAARCGLMAALPPSLFFPAYPSPPPRRGTRSRLT